MDENNINNENQANQPQNSQPQVAPEQTTQPEPVIAPEVIMPSYKPPRDPKIIRVVAGGIIAIVMVIGLSIFMTSLSKKVEPSTNPGETTDGSDKKESVQLTESEKQTLVKNVLNQVKDAAISLDSSESSDDKSEDVADTVKTTYSVQDVYDSDNPAYLATGAKAPTSTEKSFGFIITAPDQPELIKKMAENAKTKLVKIGFTVYKDATQDIAGDLGWYNGTDRIICTPLRNAYNTLSFSCAHTSWISTEKVALINGLAEAYKNKEGEYPAFISAKPEDVENSPYQPYQKITATMRGFAGLFYRASSDAKWVYFMSTQSAIPCKAYEDDAGARHAFQGDVCQDASGEMSKVTEKI